MSLFNIKKFFPAPLGRQRYVTYVIVQSFVANEHFGDQYFLSSIDNCYRSPFKLYRSI